MNPNIYIPQTIAIGQFLKEKKVSPESSGLPDERVKISSLKVGDYFSFEKWSYQYIFIGIQGDLFESHVFYSDQKGIKHEVNDLNLLVYKHSL